MMDLKKITALIAAAVLFVSGNAVRAEALNSADVSAKACVLIEAATGDIIFGKNENMKLPMASTTKIMTTLLTLESGDLDEEFTVDSEAIKVEGSSMGLTEGDIVTKRALCYGMMLPSGNDAANASAVKLGGNFADFAEMMNRRAADIGMKNTSFVTPSGLDDKDHYSTAYDMSILAAEAMKNPEFREICGSKNAQLCFENPPYTRWLRNTNKLLGFYDHCIGIKTGFTDEAGRCLVSAAEKDGVMLICVTLNAPNDWNDHIKMYDYGFSAVTKYPLSVDIGKNEMDVVGGTADKCGISLRDVPSCGFVSDKRSGVTMTVYLPEFVYAPVTAGDVVGKAVYCYNGREIASADIYTESDVSAVVTERKKGLFESVMDFVKNII